MSNHQKRILVGWGIGTVVLLAIYLLLAKSPVIHAACFFLLLNLSMFASVLWQLSRRSKDGYLTGLAFPLGLRSALLASGVLSIVSASLQLTGLWNLSWQWFCVAQLIVLAFAGWRMLMIGTGEEVIQNVESQVRSQTAGWKMLRADSEALLLSAPTKSKADFERVRDAIRYADPMSVPEVAALEEEIRNHLKQMGERVTNGEGTFDLASQIENLVCDRANRLKMLK